MPGLKFEEYDNWNIENLNLQEKIVAENVSKLFDTVWEQGIDENIYKKLKQRFDTWKISPLAVLQRSTTRKIFELQSDLGVLEYFIRIGLGERVGELDFDDKNGLKGQVERIMADSHMTPSFPQIVYDAIEAIQTDAHQPPAQGMSVFHEIDSVKGNVVRIHEIDGNISHPEAVEFDIIVERLRDTIENSEIDEQDKYNADEEIDRILMLKINYAKKIIKFHESEILKPFLS